MDKLERIEDPWGDVWCRADDVRELESKLKKLNDEVFILRAERDELRSMVTDVIIPNINIIDSSNKILHDDIKARLKMIDASSDSVRNLVIADSKIPKRKPSSKHKRSN